ncbi:MAG TPA: flagellar basal-body rod protein FlgF [Rubrivivax sp.]|jgi:flagellar basal-body rod protein FlgF|nr:flagellar basal-body rod protein FlgF [Rubrivivax sp.]
MDRLIYLSMAGAKATLQRQDSLANNLANASTTGFRAEMQAFRAVPVRGDGATTRAYVMESSIGHDTRPGPTMTTSRPLDVAVQGNSWLAVQSLDGTEAYTRNGNLHLNNEGLLVTANGLPVQGDGGPLTVPANAVVEVTPGGQITAAVGNGRPQVVGRLKLVTPEDKMVRGDDGLFRAADGADLPNDENARVQSGALEGSNVSPVETMVAMIAAARQFEQQMKMLQGAEAREQGAAKLLGSS